MNSIANRLVLALLICTFVLCATLILIYQIDGARLSGIPLLSWLGYLLGLVLSILLMLSMLRNRN